MRQPVEHNTDMQWHQTLKINAHSARIHACIPSTNPSIHTCLCTCTDTEQSLCPDAENLRKRPQQMGISHHHATDCDCDTKCHATRPYIISYHHTSGTCQGPVAAVPVPHTAPLHLLAAHNATPARLATNNAKVGDQCLATFTSTCGCIDQTNKLMTCCTCVGRRQALQKLQAGLKDHMPANTVATCAPKASLIWLPESTAEQVHIQGSLTKLAPAVRSPKTCSNNLTT